MVSLIWWINHFEFPVRLLNTIHSISCCKVYFWISKSSFPFLWDFLKGFKRIKSGKSSTKPSQWGHFPEIMHCSVVDPVTGRLHDSCVLNGESSSVWLRSPLDNEPTENLCVCTARATGAGMIEKSCNPGRSGLEGRGRKGPSTFSFCLIW